MMSYSSLSLFCDFAYYDFKGKLHFFEYVADSSKILMEDENIDAFLFSVRSVAC